MAEVLLHAEGLGKTYGTVAKTVALTDVSFDLRGGEFASIIGQSSSAACGPCRSGSSSTGMKSIASCVT